MFSRVSKTSNYIKNLTKFLRAPSLYNGNNYRLSSHLIYNQVDFDEFQVLIPCKFMFRLKIINLKEPIN